jgi:RNA polymerase sigma-70 factor (ECF subfamily)
MESLHATIAADARPTHDDAKLVRRLQARDKSAMAELLRAHGSKLYGVTLQITRNETDAEEAMQDALVNIWNKIGAFEGRSAFTSWMYRVATNAALMKRRKNKRHERDISLDDDGPDHDQHGLQVPDPGHGPATTLEHNELGQRVRAAIDDLDEPYRMTVILADVDELSMDEIARRMNVTVPAVKSRLHRGRLALRKVLAPHLGAAGL